MIERTITQVDTQAAGPMINRRVLLGAALGVAGIAAFGREAEAKAKGPCFKIDGAPAEPNGIVELALEENGYKSTLGEPFNSTFAEPGGLWVGDDFSQETIDESRGNIERINSLNQIPLTQKDASISVPEGGWTHFASQAMKVVVDGVTIEVDAGENGIQLGYIRGLYKDGDSPEDRNRTAKVSGYTPGHGMAMTKDAGEDGVAFLSEGQLFQEMEKAVGDSQNCGAEGCRTVLQWSVDLNTKAYHAVKVTTENGQQTTELIDSNWAK